MLVNLSYLFYTKSKGGYQMGKLDIREIEAKNEVIKKFNLWTALYEDKLNKLGITHDKNLAEVLRDVVHNFEKDFSVYQENAFYSYVYIKRMVY